MYLPQTDTELRNALLDAADIAVTAFAVKTGTTKAYVSVSKAGRMHGPVIVKKWLEAGLIHPNSDGRLSVVELEATAKATFTRKLKPITK